MSVGLGRAVEFGCWMGSGAPQQLPLNVLVIAKVTGTRTEFLLVAFFFFHPLSISFFFLHLFFHIALPFPFSRDRVAPLVTKWDMFPFVQPSLSACEKHTRKFCE